MVSGGVSWGLRYREEAARLHQRGAASLVGCDALQYYDYRAGSSEG